MTIDEIIEIGDIHFRDMVSMGWCDRTKSDRHYLMLVIGEICEAIQAHRKGKVFFNFNEPPGEWTLGILDDPCSPDILFLDEFNRFCKDTVADEMADTFLRLLSFFWMSGFAFSYKKQPVCFKEHETFTETAYRFTNSLFSQYHYDARDCIEYAIFFIDGWSASLGIDLKGACERKIRYNRMRSDWRNKIKIY